MVNDLHLLSFKFFLIQVLKPIDHLERRQFVIWILEHYEVNTSFWR